MSALYYYLEDMIYNKLDNVVKDRQCYGEEIRQIIHEALITTISGTFSKHRDYPYFTSTARYSKEYHEDYPHFPVRFPNVLLNWAGMDTEHNWAKEDLLVLDLETTGLGRGGIIAFMIGLGHFIDDDYIVEQVFLPEPDAEINSFDRILQLIEEKSVLVTFNGKTFDLPVLESRFLCNQIWINLREKEHIDVLHLARRLWKKRAPSCALETLEYYILGNIRDAELDIEGSVIPQTYYQFLTSGDPELVRRIFVHNQLDVLYTAKLLGMICQSIDYPDCGIQDHRIDYHAVAKLYLSQGYRDTCETILNEIFAAGQCSPDIVYDIGMLAKKQKDWTKARLMFEAGADLYDQRCLLELVMLLENKAKDYQQALEYLEKLFQLQIVANPPNEKKLTDLEKRRQRILKKHKIKPDK